MGERLDWVWPVALPLVAAAIALWVWSKTGGRRHPRPAEAAPRLPRPLHPIGFGRGHVLRHIQARSGRPFVPEAVRGRTHTPVEEAIESSHGSPLPAYPVSLPPRVTFPLDECLTGRLEHVRPLAQRRGVSVFCSGLEGVHVTAGPDRLRQVLQVILEGALERAPRGDGLVVITVREKPHADQIQVTVSDNGRTLSDGDLARAFALDTEVRPGTRPVPGLGFPLAVARRLARQDGGDLHIAPAAGGGTVLALLLPRHLETTRHEDPPHGH